MTASLNTRAPDGTLKRIGTLKAVDLESVGRLSADLRYKQGAGVPSVINSGREWPLDLVVSFGSGLESYWFSAYVEKFWPRKADKGRVVARLGLHVSGAITTL